MGKIKSEMKHLKYWIEDDACFDKDYQPKSKQRAMAKPTRRSRTASRLKQSPDTTTANHHKEPQYHLEESPLLQLPMELRINILEYLLKLKQGDVRVQKFYDPLAVAARLVCCENRVLLLVCKRFTYGCHAVVSTSVRLVLDSSANVGRSTMFGRNDFFYRIRKLALVVQREAKSFVWLKDFTALIELTLIHTGPPWVSLGWSWVLDPFNTAYDHWFIQKSFSVLEIKPKLTCIRKAFNIEKPKVRILYRIAVRETAPRRTGIRNYGAELDLIYDVETCDIVSRTPRSAAYMTKLRDQRLLENKPLYSQAGMMAEVGSIESWLQD